MRALAAVMMLLAGGGYTCQAQASGARYRQVLETSTDRDALEHAAIALAASGNAQDLAFLGQFLRDPQFLARLDDLNDSNTRHLGRVMAALREHPGPRTADLCLTLAEDPAFVSVDDRKSFLLEVLAAVKPMNERTAELFRRANDEGYFAFGAALLARNGSPRALSLFGSMMLDRHVAAQSRVECLHKGILPRRTDPAILRVSDRILSQTSERAIAVAIVESLFDYKPQWFGLESGVSRPPDWKDAPAESRSLAFALADKALARRDLSPSLRETVRRVRERIESLKK